MGQAELLYADADQHLHKPRLGLFHDQPFLRAEMASDFEEAGFQIGENGDVDSFLFAEFDPACDVIVLDCRQVDARRLAALAGLDTKIAQSSVQLVVMISLDVLDAVFTVLDQCDPQFLVEPTRAERVIAVGRCSSEIGQAKLREMSAEERMQLIRLSQQIDALAKRVERDFDAAGKTSFRDDSIEWTPNETVRAIGTGKGSAKLALPDPQHIRQLIQQRQARARFFDADLFGEPAWDMLLDLAAAKGEGTPVSVTSLCIASGVPATTALRWIKQMVDDGLFQRKQDTDDGRRVFIALSDEAEKALALYFAECGDLALAA